ncbi:hypothetical protein BC827DRAFT_1154161 [Russula dissimulans]|nr:hypothetical protein BC827DRAFT_1154161 [Russula dissimulans]
MCRSDSAENQISSIGNDRINDDRTWCANSEHGPTPPCSIGKRAQAIRQQTGIPSSSNSKSSATRRHAGHLQWIPQSQQVEVFAARPPAPTIPETVLVQLRSGQAIEMEMHAVKGPGKDYAKFSLVVNPVPPHLATRFRDSFSPGVINVTFLTHHSDSAVNVEPEGTYTVNRKLEAIRVDERKISAMKAAVEVLRAQGEDIQMANT